MLAVMTVIGGRWFTPARPIGERCGHAVIVDDGRARNEWRFEIEEVRDEMAALQKNRLDPKLSPAEMKDYWQKLMALLEKARAGRIRIGETWDADAKVIRDLILELRPLLDGNRIVFNRRPRKLRLYYGEPNTQPSCLLALHLDTKEADEAGKDEQNISIAEAVRRAHEWAQAA